MAFSDDDDLIAQWWEEEDDSDDDNDYIIAAAVILGMEHERTKIKRHRSVLGRQAVLRDIPSGNLCTMTNKRPRKDNSTSSPEKVGQEEEVDSSNSQTPDSSQPSHKKRLMHGREKEKSQEKANRKEASKGEDMEWRGSWTMAAKKEERKLKEEIWKETKSLQEQKLALEKRKLMWKKEEWIMFCDVSNMEPTQKAYVLAMRARIASQKMSFLNESFGGANSVLGGGTHGGSCSFGDGNGGDTNGGEF